MLTNFSKLHEQYLLKSNFQIINYPICKENHLNVCTSSLMEQTYIGPNTKHIEAFYATEWIHFKP